MCESTQLLDQQMAIRWRIKHALYNENPEMEIKPCLLGQIDRQNSSTSAA